MLAEPMVTQSEVLDPTFMGQILSPYRPTGTDYLKSARVTQSCLWDDGQDADTILTLEGRYSIHSSCYIQSTGHFNAVEFLICYNQLAYAAFGYLVKSRMADSDNLVNTSVASREHFSKLSYDDYLQQQLSSMFILKAATRFKRVISAADFTGELKLTKFLHRSGACFANSFCSFRDDAGGYADGEVLLAYPLTA